VFPRRAVFGIVYRYLWSRVQILRCKPIVGLEVIIFEVEFFRVLISWKARVPIN